MDLSFLKPLYAATGPYCTAVLATGKHSEHGARELELRWRALADELRQAGAPDSDVAPLAEEVGGVAAGTAPEGLLLVSAGGRLLLRHELPEPPFEVAARRAGRPHIGELVRQASRRFPHVVVVADRMGGTVRFYGQLDEELVSRGLSGSDLYVTKVKVGGWTNVNYQRRTELTWERNVSQVVSDVEALVAALRPGLVLVAGDVRARTMLLDQLSPPARELVRVVEHPGADSPRDDVVDEFVRDAAREQVRAAREALGRELGRGGAAAAGLAPVRSAFQRGQVATLVLDMPFLASPPIEGVDDELFRAAVQTGAELLVSDEPTGYPDGCAARLRYADGATP